MVNSHYCKTTLFKPIASAIKQECQNDILCVHFLKITTFPAWVFCIIPLLLCRDLIWCNKCFSAICVYGEKTLFHECIVTENDYCRVSTQPTFFRWQHIFLVFSRCVACCLIVSDNVNFVLMPVETTADRNSVFPYNLGEMLWENMKTVRSIYILLITNGNVPNLLKGLRSFLTNVQYQILVFKQAHKLLIAWRSSVSFSAVGRSPKFCCTLFS